MKQNSEEPSMQNPLVFSIASKETSLAAQASTSNTKDSTASVLSAIQENIKNNQAFINEEYKTSLDAMSAMKNSEFSAPEKKNFFQVIIDTIKAGVNAILELITDGKSKKSEHEVSGDISTSTKHGLSARSPVILNEITNVKAPVTPEVSATGRSTRANGIS